MKFTLHILSCCFLFFINPSAILSQKNGVTTIEKELALAVGFDLWVLDSVKSITDSVFAPTHITNWRDENNNDLNKVSLKLCATVEKSNEIITKLGEIFWQKGYLIVFTKHETNPIANEMYVIKTNNQFVALDIKGTNANNYGKGSDWVLEFVQDINTRYPFRIIQIELDMIVAEFITQPADWLSFAKELYIDCPDIVEQGVGSVEELALEMQKTNQLFLWWD